MSIEELSASGIRDQIVENYLDMDGALLDINPEVFEEGFCKDDIYAKHLKKKFNTLNPLRKKLKRYKSRRSRKRVRRQHELEGLFYARNRMNGSTSPYYGAIPVTPNEKVDFWIRYYKTTGRRAFLKWLVRGEAVKKLVLPILKDHGMPPELFYLAMVESGFNNTASSSARATGTWQFMRGTARLYGLKINHFVDERRDPVKSTVAAATLLQDLYKRFGDWYLAMAAYNAGPGKVRSAIRRSHSRDFWKIAKTRYLARETKNYVPKVLAATLLAANQKAHGFDVSGATIEGTPTTSVKIKQPAKLSEIASELGITLKTIKRWNPELIRGITPPSDNGYPLRLSPNYANAFADIEQNLSFIEVRKVHMHKIRSGDTLSQIARKYKVRMKQIRAVNPRLRSRALRIGRSIAIPVPSIISHKKKKRRRDAV